MSEFSKLNKSLSWHALSTEECLTNLQSDLSGLSQDEAKKRQTELGRNELIVEKGESPFILLLNQFKSLLIIILIVAAVISFYMNDVFEAYSIITIVILAGVLGFIQEFQAGKAIEALRKMASPHAHVLRDSKEMLIEAADLVPGDVMLIKMGDKIPADGRLIESVNLRIEEAALTGESTASEKNSLPIPDSNAPLGDRKNMVYMGTTVSYGRGKVLVSNIGMQTEFGKIAGMLQSGENRRTPLQENLDGLGKRLGIFSIALATIMSLIGIAHDERVAKMFTWGVALAVAIIPEALPAVVTISLALGVRRMVKRKALIRKLPAVETLGATDIICSDKTGTLTQDEMTIREIYCGTTLFHVSGAGYTPQGSILVNGLEVKIAESPDLQTLLTAGTVCSDTLLQNTNGVWDIIGDPTEGAIVVAAQKAGLQADDLKQKLPRVQEIPFSSERKRMTTIHRSSGKIISFSKGAAEIILDSCKTCLVNGQTVPLTSEIKSEIMHQSFEMSENALRVLAIAQKSVDEETTEFDNYESEMTFLGIVGMIDPPRPEVKIAIEKCFSAGIKPIMITGDHKITAMAVAKELGILRRGKALSGQELELLNDDEFEYLVDATEVYARISPEHKMKIVDTLMRKGHIVAMTGDGVNDAPSLKRADIGVAMGITGTDVSKEAADMILTDDNFTSIVNAVEEGRSIFDNIRKYLLFLLSGNMGTVFALIFTLMTKLPIPLSAVQILFINFIMDGLMAIALGMEPSDPRIMQKKPRRVQEGILNQYTLIYIGFIGILIAIICSGVYVWAIESKLYRDDAQTIFFLTLIFARLFNGFNCRSLDRSILEMNFFSNWPLLISGILSLAMSLFIVQVPILKKAFAISDIDAFEWFALIVASSFVLFVVELWKRFFKGWEN